MVQLMNHGLTFYNHHHIIRKLLCVNLPLHIPNYFRHYRE